MPVIAPTWKCVASQIVEVSQSRSKSRRNDANKMLADMAEKVTIVKGLKRDGRQPLPGDVLQTEVQRVREIVVGELAARNVQGATKILNEWAELLDGYISASREQVGQ